MEHPVDYRDYFRSSSVVSEYEESEFGPRSHSSMLWEVEKGQLARIIAELRSHGEPIRYLDFATGTGRVIEFVAPLVDSAVGVDISPEMAELAEAKVDCPILAGDLTRTPGLLDDYAPFDLITGFRFLLNAGPELRASALRSLRGLLRDERSLLVMNNHSNLLSHKALPWPVHRLRHADKVTSGNYLTHRELARTFEACGLEIVARYGAGVVPARIYSLVRKPDAALAVEQRAASAGLTRFGANQMYVLRRAAD